MIEGALETFAVERGQDVLRVEQDNGIIRSEGLVGATFKSAVLLGHQGGEYCGFSWRERV